MKLKNWMSLLVASVVVLVGVLLCINDLYWQKTDSKIWISVGCSLIASGLVIILTTLLVDKEKQNPLEEWKIDKIYMTRAEKNADSDPKLDNAKKCVDGIAFGLSKFRSQQNERVIKCLQRGIYFRFITMNPKSKFVEQRDIEENDVAGKIEKSINDLITWANDLNSKKYPGRILIKGYDCMTLDFYWRVDDELYIGPYLLGKDSSITVTYKFLEKGKGFKYYSDYFEQLWEREDFIFLTLMTGFKKNKR